MRKSPKVTEVLPVLYLRGLSTGDFAPALEGFFGSDAGLSASTVNRLTEAWQAEHQRWSTRDLSAVDYVYMWADGVYPRVRLPDAEGNRDPLCLLVIVGVRADGTKELVTVADGYRESTESWAEVLRELRDRGMAAPVLAVGDGALGLWNALGQVWPATLHQRCWVHKTVRVLSALPKRLHPRAKALLHAISYAESRTKALAAAKEFADELSAHPKAVAKIMSELDVLLTFYDFPEPHWKHLRTTNPILVNRLQGRGPVGTSPGRVGSCAYWLEAAEVGRDSSVVGGDGSVPPSSCPWSEPEPPSSTASSKNATTTRPSKTPTRCAPPEHHKPPRPQHLTIALDPVPLVCRREHLRGVMGGLMHNDDVTVSEELARRLIDSQFPDYAGLALCRRPSVGTVNMIFRLGSRLSVRFPRRAGDTNASRAALEREAARAAEFADASPVDAPRPMGTGSPADGYPMAWSIQTWLSGSTASPIATADSTTFGGDLAALISALRATPTRGRVFTGRGRGGTLRSHDGWVETCLSNSEHLLDVAALRRLWRRLRTTPRDQPDQMTHGDLIPGNLLVADGRLVGVLDTGGFGPADPALDLVAAWHLLGDEAREAFRDALLCDDTEWDRGKGWAFQQAAGAAWYYENTNPDMHQMGMTTLGRLLAADT